VTGLRTVVGTLREKIVGGTLTVVEGRATTPEAEIGQEPVLVGRSEGCTIAFPDDKAMSGVHFELVATPRGVALRDKGSTNGTIVNGQPVRDMDLVLESRIQAGRAVLAFAPKTLPIAIPAVESFGPLVGVSGTMRKLFKHLGSVARTDLSVLIIGETGVGKELVAQAIHQGSPRKTKPFVIIDCAAIPPSLVESTLFGHERGAFTGATERRISPFVEANGGTVFLDEIGELPIELQSRLLRVLAEGRLQSVGGRQYVDVDVRVLAATNQDLLRMINAKTFRADLFFRLQQDRVDVPPLRDRLEDLEILVEHLLRQQGVKNPRRRLPEGWLENLKRHTWPGNVRELKNVVLRAYALSDGGLIDLSVPVVELASDRESNVSDGRRLEEMTFEESQRLHDTEYWRAMLLAAGGNISLMAKKADRSRSRVTEVLDELGLRPRAGGAPPPRGRRR
jgi:DNA-binding NtrC family response regulator